MDTFLGLLMFVSIWSLALYFAITDNKPVARKPIENLTPMPVKKVSYSNKPSLLPQWFCVPDIKPSPAEKLIIGELKKYKCPWFREVSFSSFPSSKWGYYRYDFFIPSLRLMIEYQGEKWHSSDKRKSVDTLKKDFCKKHGIKMIYLDKKHYYKMENTIASLMKKYSISLV